MGAIKALCPIGEAGVLATQAGHDLLLVCHDFKAQKEVYDTLLEAYKNRQLPVAELEESVARISLLKSKRERRFEPGESLPDPTGAALADEICRKSVQVLRENRQLLPISADMKKIGVIFPQFSSLDAKIMIEKEILAEEEFIRREFRKFDRMVDIQLVGIEPSDLEIKQAMELAGSSDLTVFFCYDAHLYANNKHLLDALQDAARELVVDLLRDPYDAAYVKAGVACLTDFGWRACQLRAAIAKICSAIV